MKTNRIGIKEKLLLGTLCLVFLITVYSAWEGKKQDQEWLADYRIFEDAENYYSKIKFDKAFPLYQQLVQKHQYSDSVAICWGMAQILKDRKEIGAAIEYYERIRQAYPSIVMDQDFLEEYGGALSMAGDQVMAEFFQTKGNL